MQETIEGVTETIGDAISEAIEDANAQAEVSEQVAKDIAAAAMESERGRELDDIKRRMDEWQTIQDDQSQAIAAMAIGLSEMSGQLTALQSILQPPPTPNPQDAADGQRESQEAEVLDETPAVTVETTIESPETPPAPVAPRKKRHNWI